MLAHCQKKQYILGYHYFQIHSALSFLKKNVTIRLEGIHIPKRCWFFNFGYILMEKDRNIFEAASKELRKKAKKPVSDQASPPPEPSEAKDPKKMSYGSEDPEVMEMFLRIRKMKRELDSNFNELRSKDVDRFIEKIASNYPGEVEKMKQKEKTFLDRLNSIFTPEACVKKNPKSKEKLTQERKGKTLGGRKKWIPMQ